MQRKHYYSPFGFYAFWQTDLVIGLYFCALLIAKNHLYAGSIISSVGFICFVLVLLFGVPLYMRRPSPLSIGLKRIREFEISGFNWNIKVPSVLIAYEDSIEVRLFFDSLLIPYSSIVSEPLEIGTLVKSIRLSTDIPGLPKVWTIHACKGVRKELSLLIKSKLAKASGAAFVRTKMNL